ncbi:MAG: Fur family transcriptional regulator [Verrucomicrobiota bacterium]
MAISYEVRQRIESFLSDRGLRMTRPREVIIEAIFQSDEHFTAEELQERVRAIDENASRATVYRTLSMLVEGGLLHELDLGRGVTCYDPNFIEHPNHNHLICVDCHRVVEFEDAHMELLNDCITKRLGFSAASKSIRIEASCDELRRAGFCRHKKVKKAKEEAVVAAV